MKLFPLEIDFMTRVIAFEFKIINKNDQALINMSACIHSEEQIGKTELEEPVRTLWYKSDAIKKDIMLKMRQFSSFATSNADNECIDFIVTDTSDDTSICDKGVQIVSYINGELHDQDFEPPSSPQKLVYSSVQSNGIKLAWSKPEYGSTSVQSYTVFYHTEDDSAKEYKLKEMKCAETAVIISDLIPNTSYILKIQANCTTGKSEISENIKVKTGAPMNGDDQYMEDNPTGQATQQSTSTPKALPVQIPTLGRSFQFGMLYDYHKDCLLRLYGMMVHSEKLLLQLLK